MHPAGLCVCETRRIFCCLILSFLRPLLFILLHVLLFFWHKSRFFLSNHERRMLHSAAHLDISFLHSSVSRHFQIYISLIIIILHRNVFFFAFTALGAAHICHVTFHHRERNKYFFLNKKSILRKGERNHRRNPIVSRQHFVSSERIQSIIHSTGFCYNNLLFYLNSRILFFSKNCCCANNLWCILHK